MFWFQPNYTSVPDGGNGPTNWASLLTIGQWTANASASCWSLVIDPDGTNLAFLAQSNGASQIVLTAPIDFDAGDWHSICLTYSSDGCWLYLEGQPVTNAGPIAYTPSDSDCVEYGLSVGSEGGTNGVFQARGNSKTWRLTMTRFPPMRLRRTMLILPPLSSIGVDPNSPNSRLSSRQRCAGPPWRWRFWHRRFRLKRRLFPSKLCYYQQLFRLF